MPTAPLRYCTHPGCSTKVVSGKCAVHKGSSSWGSGPHVVKRIRGRKLQRMRNRLFERSPLCVLCEQEHRFTLATVRDHIIPLAEGGTEDPSNEQALCYMHNELKRQEEAKRGMERAK